MALTPEDVVNKRFQPTKFREGYDQDEVDDFLDEVVVELRRLNQENEELRQRIIASDARISELQRSGAQPAPAPAPAPAFTAPAPVAAAPEPAPTPAPAYSAPAVDANPLDPNNTNNLLQLARRLHEEHVREGVEKKEALIAEGQAEAQRLQQEAEQLLATRQAELDQQLAARQAEVDQLVQSRQAEIEQQGRAKLTALEQERAQLESRVDELRTFEREYRAKLKNYIEGQLRELDDATVAAAPAPAAATPGFPPPAPATGFPTQSASGQAAPNQGVPNYLGFAQN